MSRIMLIVFLVLVLVTSGCSWMIPPAREDTVTEKRMKEIERRADRREEEIAKLQSEVQALKAQRYELRNLLKETSEAAASLAQTGEMPADKPLRFEVTTVEFGMLTCAVDEDGKKGDDAIAAYVHLYDQYDFSMKAAGAIRFDLFDLSRAEDQVIQSWSFTPEDAARRWKRFPAGYHFKLPLSGDIGTKDVILKVTFQEAGRKPLTARCSIEVELP